LVTEVFNMSKVMQMKLDAEKEMENVNIKSERSG
jgi:hypothetical protein